MTNVNDKIVGLVVNDTNEKGARDYIEFNAPNCQLTLHSESETDSDGLKQFVFKCEVSEKEFLSLESLKDIQIVVGFVEGTVEFIEE